MADPQWGTGLFAQVKAQQAAAADPITNWFQGFAKSGSEHALELFGRDPSLDTLQWDRDHPVAAIVAEWGPGLAYGGGALKLGKIGKFGKWVDSLAGEAHPVLRYAAREAVRFAPFELGRVGITAATGGDTEEVALDALMGVTLAGGFGAGMGAFEAAGKALRRKWGLSDVLPTAPNQLQGRALADKLRQGGLAPELNTAAQEQLERFRKDILLERPSGPKAKALPKELEQGVAQQLERTLFRPKPTKGEFYTKSLTRGVDDQGHYGQQSVLEADRADFDMPDGWEFYSQYPRLSRAMNAKAMGKLDGTVRRNMMQISKDTWVTQEKGGLYVMARRGKSGERWLAWKTDEPRRFVDDPLLGKVEAQTAWLRAPTQEEVALRGASPTLAKARNFRDAVPLSMISENIPRSKVGEWSQNVAKAMSKFYGYGDAGEAVVRLRSFTDRYLAPAMHQFRGNAVARYVHAGMRMVFDEANARHAAYMIGTKQVGNKPLGAVLKGVQPTGGLMKLINELEEVDLVKLSKVMTRGMSREEATALGSPRVDALLAELDKVDGEVLGELQALQKLSGRNVVKARKNHFMLQRTYPGDWFLPIYEGKKLVAVAGAAQRGPAFKEAERIIQYAASKGKVWEHRNEITLRGNGDDVIWKRLSTDKEDMVLAAEAREVSIGQARRPDAWKARKDMQAGYAGHEDLAVFTKPQLQEIVSGHLQQNMRYIADMATRQEFGELMQKIRMQDSAVFRQLEERLNDLLGVKNTADRWQNKIVDQALSPILGANSASKIVRGFNEYTYHIQLGAFNLAFPFVQLLSFAQTVIPEIAYLSHGAPEGLSRYYTNFLVGGADGKPRQIMGMLDTWKLMGRSFRVMGDPARHLGADADEYVSVLNRALSEGVLEPRMVEEFIGPTARLPATLKGVASGQDGIVEYLKQLSSFGPEMSERASRLHAITVGYEFGKNILGLRDEGLFRFIKEFNARTMFGYTVADRPRIFTGPFGSALGLFKNWQMHYIYNWMDYAGEAVSRGNFRPLLWGSVGTGALGGLPATGALYAAANAGSQLFANESLMNLWYDTFHREGDQANWSDAIYMGLPAFLPPLMTGGLVPGISLTSQASTPGADPSRDVGMLMSFVYWDRMKSFGQLAGALWDQSAATGMNPARSEQIQGLLARTFAPKSIYRVQQSLSEGMINASSTIYPTQSGLTGTEQMLYAMGFNPANVELAYRAGEELWADQNAMRATVSAMGAAWAEAQQRGDYDALREIQKQAMVQGVDFSKVMNSAATRMKKASVDMFSRTFDRAKVQRFQESGLLRD